MTVRKAVILAAGHGTRFLPATKAVPKEMLPLVDAPIIQYIVQEAVDAGLTHITIVSAASKRALEDHFDRNLELEDALESGHRDAALREVRRLADMADIAFVRQKQRLGNGHAVLMAKQIVGDEPFAIYFPDDVIVSETPAIRQLMDVFERRGGSVLALQRLPREEVIHYGVIKPEPLDDRTYRVRGIVEKPSVEEAPSDLTTVGRFVVTPRLISILEETPPGRAGEIWLMDALDRLAQEEPVFGYEYEGQRFDTGQPLGLLQASVSLALAREDIGPALKRYLRTLSLD